MKVGGSGIQKTKRLILRSWTESDMEPFYAINQDERVVEFLAGKMTKDEVKNFITNTNQHIEQHGFGLWSCCLKDSGELIGFVGLKLQTFQAKFTPCIEVGWRLSSKHWGQGYATEAAREALRIGFEEFGLQEIVSFTTTKNTRSIAVMERLGMKRDFDCDFDHPNLPQGHDLSPHVLYRITNPKQSTFSQVVL